MNDGKITQKYVDLLTENIKDTNGYVLQNKLTRFCPPDIGLSYSRYTFAMSIMTNSLKINKMQKTPFDPLASGKNTNSVWRKKK